MERPSDRLLLTMYFSNLKPYLLYQRVVHLVVEGLGYFLFKEFELVDPSGAGYVYKKDTILKSGGFCIHGDGGTHR